MPLLLANVIDRYTRFYVKSALDFWNTMSPMEYGMLLIGVALFGFILMRSQR